MIKIDDKEKLIDLRYHRCLDLNEVEKSNLPTNDLPQISLKNNKTFSLRTERTQMTHQFSKSAKNSGLSEDIIVKRVLINLYFTYSDDFSQKS